MTKNTKMKTTTMKRIQTFTKQFQTLISLCLIVLLTLGQQNSFAIENQKNNDSCCAVKTKLIDHSNAAIAIKLPTSSNWALADYEISHSLYLELNPVLNGISTKQLNNSDKSIQQMFDENFKISEPIFADADISIQASFIASNTLLINNNADVVINNLFWKENTKTCCSVNSTTNCLLSLPVKINQPLQLDWEKSDEAINLQIFINNTTQESGI